MKIKITGKELKITEAINDYVEKKLERIDKYLTHVFEGKSRSYLQGLIEKGNILVNDKNIKSNYKLRLYDEVKVTSPEPLVLKAEPEDIPLNII